MNVYLRLSMDIHLAVRQMDLSARAYHRAPQLGRTIADLAGEEKIEVAHLAEAIQYRPRGWCETTEATPSIIPLDRFPCLLTARSRHLRRVF